MPLLIIIVAFDAFSGEQTNGTLRQLFANGMSPTVFALGKSLASLVKLGLLLVPAAIISLLLLAWIDKGSLQTGLGRAVWMLLAYGFYFASWLFFSLWISSKTATPRSSLAILLAFWIAGCVVLPRLAVDISRSVYRTPSSLDFEKAVAKDLALPSSFQEELKRNTLAKYHVSRLEDLPVSFAGISLTASEEHSSAVYETHMGLVRDQFLRQNHLRGLLGAIDPTLAIHQVSMAFSGTDYTEQRRFAEAGENYRELFISYLNGDMTKHGTQSGYVATKEVFQQVPRFHYDPPEVGELLRRNGLLLAVLAAQAIAIGVLFLISTRKLGPLA